MASKTGLSGLLLGPTGLIGDLPDLYIYAANQPPEGMIAKRPRLAATLISYLTRRSRTCGTVSRPRRLKAPSSAGGPASGRRSTRLQSSRR